MSATSTTEILGRTTTRALIRVAWLWPALLVGAVAVFNLLSLMNTPAPFVDEAWNASRAQGLLQTGHQFGTLDSGVFERYPVYWTVFPWLGTAIHSVFILLLGPTLFAVRVASLCFGLVLLALVYLIGKRLYNARVGLIAALLLATSAPFLYSAHMGRHDIIATAFGFGAVALYFLERDARPRKIPFASILAGLLVGLTADVHLNGIIFAPTLAALYLVDDGWRVVKDRRFWDFVAGGVLAVLYFVAIHVLPDPASYFAVGSLGNGSRVTPPIMEFDPGLWFTSLQSALLLVGPITSILVVLALVAGLRRRSIADKRVITLFAVLFVAFAEIVRNKVPWYLIVVAPAICLLVAPFVESLIESRGRWRTSLPAFALSALVIMLVVLLGGANLLSAWGAPNNDYDLALQAVKRTVPEGASIVGTQTYWFALPDSRYLSWDQLVYEQRYSHGSLEDAFQTLHPDYFIMDGWMDLFVTDDPARLATVKSNTLLDKSQLESFLADHAQLAESLPTRTFGTLRIYKIDWSR